MNGGGWASVVGRWRKRPAADHASGDTQGTFFPQPDEVRTESPAAFTPSRLPALKPTHADKPGAADPELTPDQAAALKSIEKAYEPGTSYLLTGHAGRARHT